MSFSRDVYPETKRLHRIVGEEMFRVLVSCVRRLRALAPIDEGAGIGEDAMVTFRAVPSRPERHRSPGAAAVGHAAVRILCQRNAGVIFKAALLAGALATIS